jgi:hypothetical protein
MNFVYKFEVHKVIYNGYSWDLHTKGHIINNIV